MKKHPYIISVLLLFLIVALFGITRSYYMINPAQCDGCGECVTHCPNNAIYFDQELSVMRIDDQLCDGCGDCVAYCPRSAIILADSSGYIMGTVFGSETGFPIRNALIAADSFYCTSGLWGEYCINLPAGIHTLTCSAEGYIDQIVTDLEVNSDQILQHNFIISPANSNDSDELTESRLEGYFSPNPYQVETRFYLNSEEPVHKFTLEIYNLKGQRIRQFSSSDLRGNSIYWNSTDHKQKRIPAGIYLYRYTGRQQTYSGKLTCLPD